jgi:ABC-type cobalamin transport system ATPase subunit
MLFTDSPSQATPQHDVNLAAATANHLVLLARGRVARAGPPEEVLRDDVLSGLRMPRGRQSGIRGWTTVRGPAGCSFRWA